MTEVLRALQKRRKYRDIDAPNGAQMHVVNQKFWGKKKSVKKKKILPKVFWAKPPPKNHPQKKGKSRPPPPPPPPKSFRKN